MPDAAIAPLPQTYRNVPARQVETSVVLACPALSAESAAQLVQTA